MKLRFDWLDLFLCALAFFLIGLRVSQIFTEQLNRWGF